jgi:hypothetical protein
MITPTLTVIILVGAGLSLLLAYGQARWFGRKFHRAIYAANALNYFSFMFFFFLLARQSDWVWRPYLMAVATLTWLLTNLWTRRIEQAQKMISQGAIAAEEKRR